MKTEEEDSDYLVDHSIVMYVSTYYPFYRVFVRKLMVVFLIVSFELEV